MNFWILQTGEPLPLDNRGLRPMRAINLSNCLIAKGHSVVLWSSNFDHFTKTHRYSGSKRIRVSDKLEVQLVNSSGYKSNISFARLFDHFQLGLNLWRLMRKEKKPDLAFVGYPPIETAWIMTRFLRKSSVPVVLDVKDSWPDVLARGIPKLFRPLAKFLLFPYYAIMHSTFRKSTFISSISPDYLSWALKVSNREKSKQDRVNYLSSMNLKFSHAEISDAENYWNSRAIYDDGKLRISYVGSLTSSLNFDRVLEAAGCLNVEFVIAGSGPTEKEIIEDSSKLSNVVFPGRVSAAQASVLAQRSTALLAPYDDLDDFQISLPNKFLDAMMHGRPIITSLSGFPKNFIETNGIGRHYSNSKAGSLTNLIKDLSINASEVIQMGNKAKKLFEGTFSGEIVYSKLVESLEEIVLDEQFSSTT